MDKFSALNLDIGSEYAKESYLCGVKLGAEFIIGIAYGDNRKRLRKNNDCSEKSSPLSAGVSLENT